MSSFSDIYLNQLFLEARTHSAWQNRPVEEALLHRLYDLAKMGPTSANNQPMRLVFVKSHEAKEKLRKYGIAPPEKTLLDKNSLLGKKKKCPHCGSENTEMVSQFGSTACKALYKCSDCKEPFDYFKCH